MPIRNDPRRTTYAHFLPLLGQGFPFLLFVPPMPASVVTAGHGLRMPARESLTLMLLWSLLLQSAFGNYPWCVWLLFCFSTPPPPFFMILHVIVFSDSGFPLCYVRIHSLFSLYTICTLLLIVFFLVFFVFVFFTRRGPSPDHTCRCQKLTMKKKKKTTYAGALPNMHQAMPFGQ